ncbi:GGDEF domain-containing protein [Psychromonas marina]|nr:GGDEF domain-containing protein [Psychromonas marina]
MNKVLNIYPETTPSVFANSDVINNGNSNASLVENEQGAQLHCETKASDAWPFCSLDLVLTEDRSAGINLEKFKYLSLELGYQTTSQDTVLVYLVNADQKIKTKHGSYIIANKSNMTTILPPSGTSHYKLPLAHFFVPSWWILQNKATGEAARPKIDNVIGLSIATGDSHQLRTVDITLKNLQFSGKWISAKSLYFLIILMWLALISVHGLINIYQQSESLKLKHLETKNLEDINSFLSIQKNEFELLAKTDALTGLYNRAGTSELLQQMKANPNSVYSLIMFDIDYFKKINDNFGHEVGDEILTTLATHLQNNMRNSDHVARWGGEEFVIFCPDTTEYNALRIANTLRKNISELPFPMAINVTCSFGVAPFFAGQENSIQDMFKAADNAMYEAKLAGRNRVRIGKH